MRFERPLIRGRLIRRYKRFLSDIALEDGRVVTAHCANPGAMLGLDAVGAEVWLSRKPPQSAARLDFRWELVKVGDHFVGINTAHPNRIIAEGLAVGRIGELAGYSSHRREVAYGRNSRIDLLLEEPGRPPCYLEVKNVHLRREGRAEFPDCVTARGTKHLAELSDVARAGGRAVMVYLVQRADCAAFRIAADLDPAYDAAYRDARARGVEALCYACAVSPQAIEIDRPLDILDGDSPSTIR